ncbi:hypothetical protein [Pseudomonas viridiflava]|uniref:hypothetical protein n=1 Tax=Pseudomonas viridiflava TaxID=33069 RepID=UPI002EAE6B68|nr:hypothetical protein [Pseudomonas viridiflava]
MPAFADRDLEQRIQSAQRDIKSWAEGSDLWRDSGFTSYAERVQGEPGEEAVVFILYSDGHLARLLDEDLDPRSRAELDQIYGAHGFWFENYDGCSYYFFATTEEMQAAYDEYSCLPRNANCPPEKYFVDRKKMVNKWAAPHRVILLTPEWAPRVITSGTFPRVQKSFPYWRNPAFRR